MSQTIRERLAAAGPKFDPGRVVITPGAIELLASNNALVSTYLVRHVTGDWGDVPPEDARFNDRDLKMGRRILSAYKLPCGEAIWIVTDAVDVIQPTDNPLKREVTTILLPSEY